MLKVVVINLMYGIETGSLHILCSKGNGNKKPESITNELINGLYRLASSYKLQLGVPGFYEISKGSVQESISPFYQKQTQ